LSQPDLSPAAVAERDSTYILGTYARTGFHPRYGSGARLYDADGKAYWDLLAGIAVNALGYGHPRLSKALAEESTGLYHVSNLFYHPAQGLLAEKLVTLSGLSKVFFCNSGAEATEAVLKLARLKTPGRFKVVALDESFHGRTFAAVSITGHAPYRTPFTPLVPGAEFVPANDIEALEKAVTAETSVIMLEPIQGEGGIIPLTPAYLRAARDAADRVGAILVFDEIQCGLGRTGQLFAFMESGVVPDAVTLAKAIGGGLPLGAVLVGPSLADVIKPGQHGTTFGGNPVACRLGLEVLSIVSDPDFLQSVATLGEWFRGSVLEMKKRCPAITDVRGRGLMWGIELDRPVKPIVRELMERGFVIGSAREKVLRLLPPLVIPKDALSAFLTTLEEILTEMPVAPAEEKK
jgi:predicted acetylornithine/succinylornithine family transaminase